MRLPLPVPRAGPRPAGGDISPQTPLRDHLIIIDVPSGVHQHPSLASCYVLFPGTGCCPDLIKHVKSFSIPGSIHVLFHFYSI